MKARKISKDSKVATLRKKKVGAKDDSGMTSIATRANLPASKEAGGQSSIQALISKLRWSTGQEDPLGPDEEYISPLDLDLYCNNGTETALHHVVRMREHTITHR